MRGNDKAERPITEVAEITKVQEFAELNRVNQLRSITITGDVDRTQGVTSNMIYHADIGDGKKSFMDYFNQDIKSKYPSVYIKFEKSAKQKRID